MFFPIGTKNCLIGVIAVGDFLGIKMHKRFVANIVSRIVLIGCLLMLLPLGWAAYDDLHSLEVKAFCYTIVGGLCLSGSILAFFRIKKKNYKKINAKDGLAIVGLSWIFLSLVGACPLYLAKVVPSFTDAFFEIASGYTTTGATIFTDVEVLPRGILFWRSLTHWLGGMGIIVLYIALLPAIGTNASQLYKAEAPGMTVERVEPRIKETAKNLWGVYFLLTFLEVVLLMFGGMPVFDSLCHTFGTIATGGFSTKNASIGAYSPYIQWVVSLFMFLAGCNFVLHYMALKGHVKFYIKDEEFKVYTSMIVALSIFFACVLAISGLSASPVRDSVFQVLAIMTTTGYATADFEMWPSILTYTLVLLMLIGGCGGSTGGGMKFVRFFLSIKVALRSMIQAVFPSAIIPIKFNGKPLADKLIMGVLSYFVIFIHLLFFGALVFMLVETCDFVTGFTAALSALSNIGPGLGQIGPTDNFSWVSIPGKWLLIFLMLAGRLELYSILILFIPATWKK